MLGFYDDQCDLPEPRPNRRVVIVNGYGCELDSPLRPYLDRVRTYILQNDVHHVVFCGSATQRRTHPNMTEARVMSEYLVATLPKNFELIASHEEDSYTTCENAIGAVKILRFLQQRLWDDQAPRPGELIVFCEAQRLFKVILCYWWLLPDYRPHDGDADPGLRVQFEVDSWERANPLMEIPKVFNELAMLAFPAWRQFMRNRRIAKAEAA